MFQFNKIVSCRLRYMDEITNGILKPEHIRWSIVSVWSVLITTWYESVNIAFPLELVKTRLKTVHLNDKTVIFCNCQRMDSVYAKPVSKESDIWTFEHQWTEK